VPIWRRRQPQYVERIPAASAPNRNHRWHKIQNPEWTVCNIPIHERWHKTVDPPPDGAILCHWCWPGTGHQKLSKGVN
jgi:hypothetical protein